MPLEAERFKHYKAHLGDALQNATALIRNYYTMLCSQAPQLITQADRIWELSQRYRLVAGINEDASATLFSACQETYQPIHQFINQLHETLTEISLHVADFARESQALTQELDPLDEQLRCSLAKWNSWLGQALSILQTQAKFLELDARSMLPALVQSTTIKKFKEDLELEAHYKANICLGLAEADRKPDFLPVSLAA